MILVVASGIDACPDDTEGTIDEDIAGDAGAFGAWEVVICPGEDIDCCGIGEIV